jgi:hypothetical protein
MMRLFRIVVSGLVGAALLCVGVDGTSLSLGTSAYAKHHRKKHHRKHARRRHRKHARSAAGTTPEL